MLRLDAAHRAGLVARPEARVGALHEVQEVAGVAARRGGEGVLRRESFQRVVAQGLQQPIAELPTAARHRRLNYDQGFVDEMAEELQHRARLDPVTAADRFSRRQAPVAGEDAEPAEDRPLLLRQQLVAPVHQRTDRLVARQSRTGAAGQQAEPVTQPGGDLVGAKQPDARGRELNGQRQAIQPRADLGHRGRVPVRQREARGRGASALDEQANRFMAQEFVWRPRLHPRRYRERGHRPYRFARNIERLSGGGQNSQQRTGVEEGVG